MGTFGRRLTISRPSSSDAGPYVCEAALLDSSVKAAEARAFLFVTGENLSLPSTVFALQRPLLVGGLNSVSRPAL